ncbi:MAG: hypothetical protein U9N78_06415 [Actinomycetota bacterium]|nr:hypothetical protein [Actinomycetota bacterium]
MLIAFRTLLGVLIGVAVATALVPMLVIADLAGGGSGWGLCPEGIGTCSTSYFAGPELLAILLVVLFATLAGIAVCTRWIRRLEKGQ